MRGAQARRAGIGPQLALVAPGGGQARIAAPGPDAEPGRLWLAVHVPDLPLHALGAGSCGPFPTAVSVRHERHARVLVADEQAQAAGVEPGMSVTGARCVCPGLQVQERDEALERAMLEGLAMWSGGYTGLTSLEPPHGLLLEIGASLRLFDGLGPLLERIRGDLDRFGHVAGLGVAPTPTAAWMLARARDACPAILMSRLCDRLAALPVTCLEIPPAMLEDLHSLGVRTVGGCMRLPRDGLIRRFGPRLLALLDAALGRRPDVREPWSAPAIFERRLDLPWGGRDHSQLLAAADRLLGELGGFLRSRAAGAGALEIQIAHRDRAIASTRFTLELVSPTRDVRYLRSLLSERFERLTLPADAIDVALRVAELRPLAPVTEDLYGAAADAHDGLPAQTAPVLVERLRARLGRQRVRGLLQVADPRPERATRMGEWGDRSAVGVAGSDPFAPFMPAWLLAAPLSLACRDDRPCLDGALVLEQGPQRVEGGWWDGGDVSRDYYVARDARGARYWVFRSRRPPGGWYLHGIFA